MSLLISRRRIQGTYRQVSLASIPEKVMGQILLEDICYHSKYNLVMEGSQCGLTKGRSSLALRALHGLCEMAASVDESSSS